MLNTLWDIFTWWAHINLTWRTEKLTIKRKTKRNCKWNKYKNEYINSYYIMNWCEPDGKETRKF